MRSYNTLSCAAIMFALSSVSAYASDFDGSKLLLCAIMETAECVPGDVCVAGSAESVNLPTFINIDFKKKMITGRNTPGQPSADKPKTTKKGHEIKSRDTKIMRVEKGNGVTLLQGAQYGRGWSMALNQASGQRTIRRAGGGVSFAFYGACIASQ